MRGMLSATVKRDLLFLFGMYAFRLATYLETIRLLRTRPLALGGRFDYTQQDLHSDNSALGGAAADQNF
jgi:hypothetical protein